MTPKEKAKELIDKFCDIDYTDYDGYPKSLYSDAAKQCALIAVDEVLNFIHTDAFSYTNEEYWVEVKKELEAMK